MKHFVSYLSYQTKNMNRINTCIKKQLLVNSVAEKHHVPDGVIRHINDFAYDNLNMAWIRVEAERLKRCLHAELDMADKHRTMDGMEWSIGMSVPVGNKPFYYYKRIQGVHCGKCGEYVASVTDLEYPIAENIWCTCTDYGNFTINPGANGSIMEWIDSDDEDIYEEDFDF